MSVIASGMRSEGNAPKIGEPAQRSVLVKDLFAKNILTTLEHPPQSPVLAAADFYLYPRLKSALKGRRFYRFTDITKNETEELKRLPKMTSENVSNTFSVAGRIVYLRKGTFEGNVA